MHNEMVKGFHTIGTIDYQRVHNDLLELLVELGLFGVVLFILVVFFLIQAVIRCAKNQQKNALFYILSLIGILASFVDTKKIRYLNMADSIIYHQDLQTVLKNLAYSYDKIGTPILNIRVENKNLTYWENNFSLEKLATYIKLVGMN
ncbi:MAG: hypothetical protein Rpha_0955 [Candidatus Ruthia sp. Apha_13_S6]|nr:hypothetical protein [Candidatus Ruthia sp. Apha_13_S6]